MEAVVAHGYNPVGYQGHRDGIRQFVPRYAPDIGQKHPIYAREADIYCDDDQFIYSRQANPYSDAGGEDALVLALRDLAESSDLSLDDTLLYLSARGQAMSVPVPSSVVTIAQTAVKALNKPQPRPLPPPKRKIV